MKRQTKSAPPKSTAQVAARKTKTAKEAAPKKAAKLISKPLVTSKEKKSRDKAASTKVAGATNAQPAESIDAYIGQFPRTVQETLGRIRKLIAKAAPEAEEAMKYQIPTFVLNGNLVHFAAFEHHVGLYPTPSGIVQFQKELAGYRTAKGSIQFPLDQEIPYALIQQIVEFRVEENRAKGKKKR